MAEGINPLGRELDNTNDTQTMIEEENNQKDLVEKLREKPVTLLSKDFKATVDSVKELSQGRPTLLCDTNIKELEQVGEHITGGYKIDNIINIDHHFPTPEFSRFISSTNLAIEYVKENGPINTELRLINHKDCDSVLSVAIATGVLPPLDKYGQAAIAADHTGEPNEIADILQSIEKMKDDDLDKDIEFSLKNLQLYLDGKELDPRAQEKLEKRYADRVRALELSERMNHSEDGKIAYGETEEKIDVALMTSLLPSSELILVMSPLTYNKTNQQVEGHFECKVRLGLAAPEGINVSKFMKEKVDAQFDGRWNAGANGRGNEGSILDLETYAKKLNQEYQGYLKQQN